jgi:imidazolonepropionase-like amidohydrolase
MREYVCEMKICDALRIAADQTILAAVHAIRSTVFQVRQSTRLTTSAMAVRILSRLIRNKPMTGRNVSPRWM